MSVDTRTPRSPSGGRSPGFDEDVLNTVRVASDPAQVIVNHASFRVKLGAGVHPPRFGADDTAVMPVFPTSVRSAAEARTRRRRAAPLVWSGRTAPGEPAAAELFQAVRSAGATRLMPRIVDLPLPDGPDEVVPPVRPSVVAPRSPVVGGPLPGAVPTVPRPSRGGHDGDRPAYAGAPSAPRTPSGDSYEPAYHGHHDPHGADRATDGRDGSYDDPYDLSYERETLAERRRRERGRGEPVRHAWYPGRRMNLGVVLLPLRVFLGFVCVYAGIGKLCDPVYFDGGVRGSMVQWLGSLHPWSMAEPLRSVALGHPVGAGLTVAFLQVVGGCADHPGTVAAGRRRVRRRCCRRRCWSPSAGAPSPVYDAPDIIYLAAWSPLLIAGAPVYSIDGQLAGEAWRRLGPRAPLWDLRRYVLRRGVVLATFVAGGTLVLGSVFGSAVRASSSHLDSPATPTDLPTNNLPGSPYPTAPGSPTSRGSLVPGVGHGTRPPRTGASASAAPATPTASAVRGVPRGAASAGTGLPGRHRTVQAPRPPSTPQHPAAPADPDPSGGGSTSGSGGSLGGLLGTKSPTGFLLGMPGGHGGHEGRGRGAAGVA